MLVDLLAGVGRLVSVLGLLQLSHNINTVLLVFWSVHQLGVGRKSSLSLIQATARISTWLCAMVVRQVFS